jgi:hypothetical protein
MEEESGSLRPNGLAYFRPEVLEDKAKIELTMSEHELVARGDTEDT